MRTVSQAQQTVQFIQFVACKETAERDRDSVSSVHFINGESSYSLTITKVTLRQCQTKSSLLLYLYIVHPYKKIVCVLLNGRGSGVGGGGEY